MIAKIDPKIAVSLLITLFLAILVVFDGVPLVLGDGYSYYHPAKTLVEEGRLISDTEPEYLQYAGENISYYHGKYVTRVGPGTSVLMAPFLAASKPFDDGTIYNDYHKAFIGHSLADGIAILIASVVYTLIGVFFVIKSLEILGFSRKKAVLAMVLAYFSSHLLAYTLEFPAYTHSYEFFALAGFFYFALRLKNTQNKFFKDALFTGIFIGIAVLVRSSLILCIFPIIIYSFWGKGDIFKKLLTIGIAGLPFALIFFHYNHAAYGGFLSNGYSVLHGQNPDFTQNHTLKMLFSATRGWFVYSPLALLSIYGLVEMTRERTRIAIAILASIAISVVFFSFWPWWWSGYSIGQRFFIGLLPFVAAGIGQVLKKADSLTPELKKCVHAGLILLTLYSLSVTFLHRITPASDLPEILGRQGKHAEVPDEEEFSPLDFFRYHSKIIRETSSTGEYAKTLSESLNGGRSIALLAAGLTDPITKLEKTDNDEFTLHFIPNSTNSEITADITVSIEFNHAIYNYKIQNIDFSRYSNAKFTCSEEKCVTNWNDVITPEDSLDNQPLCLSDSLCVKLSSEAQIKFVDYRYAE